MAYEAFLVQMHKDCTTVQFNKVISQIQKWQGEILLCLPQRSVLVAAMDSCYREPLLAMSQVLLVGGVQLVPRKIRRIRVRQQG